ncbi:hypothetical protein [Staphylothermus hellenicus]|uniref:Uncharacterized protein n=1 Tax=Staphylothermus hellenicus (strain DSM 12710 / JCM 10830 / BK20S6-10-b1 / P8) TaxID=591019 RepID=D7D9D8_STAHD|nr:hypothetical protein [Staphylothermus hellenicus]ADI32384.1 hypothetical protein Shell_1291 [Staphylothermus hellenicus DSM 12710]
MNAKHVTKLLKLVKIFALIIPIISIAITLASGNTVDPTGSAGKPGGDPIEGDLSPF